MRPAGNRGADCAEAELLRQVIALARDELTGRLHPVDPWRFVRRLQSSPDTSTRATRVPRSAVGRCTGGRGGGRDHRSPPRQRRPHHRRPGQPAQGACRKRDSSPGRDPHRDGRRGGDGCDHRRSPGHGPRRATGHVDRQRDRTRQAARQATAQAAEQDSRAQQSPTGRPVDEVSTRELAGILARRVPAGVRRRIPAGPAATASRTGLSAPPTASGRPRDFPPQALTDVLSGVAIHPPIAPTAPPTARVTSQRRGRRSDTRTRRTCAPHRHPGAARRRRRAGRRSSTSWPERLPGGYVGVDVFFVISGFLITAHLLERPPRPAARPGRFWAPPDPPAAAGVAARARGHAGRVAAARSRDRSGRTPPRRRARRDAVRRQLGARRATPSTTSPPTNAPTAVQHFWSLSVEEQFYFVWPILIARLVLLRAAGRLEPRIAVLGRARRVLVAASLGYSVCATASDPAAAYFVTPTRIWELGVGGLLAVVPCAGAACRPPLSGTPCGACGGWTGLAADRGDRPALHRGDAVPGLAGLASGAGRAAAPARAPPRPSAAPPARCSRCARCSGSVTCPTRSTCGTGR